MFVLLADARPQYLKDFASQLEKLQTLAQDAKRTVRLNNIVEEMFKTLAQSNVRISSEDSVQLDDMRNAQMVRVLANAPVRSARDVNGVVFPSSSQRYPLL